MFDFFNKHKDEIQENYENILMYLIGLMDADFHRDYEEIEFIKAQAAEWHVNEKKLRSLFRKTQAPEYKLNPLSTGKFKKQLILQLK